MNDDYVKRSDVHKAFHPKYAPAINRTFAAMIDSIPAADVVERKTGEWMPYKTKTGKNWWACSLCGFVSEHKAHHNFCPNCGADMREV